MRDELGATGRVGVRQGERDVGRLEARDEGSLDEPVAAPFRLRVQVLGTGLNVYVERDGVSRVVDTRDFASQIDLRRKEHVRTFEFRLLTRLGGGDAVAVGHAGSSLTTGAGQADVRAITTHNPFAVNDLFFSRETGIKVDDMNAYGCSLVFGHPQGPTGLRSIAELIETLRLRGGGIGLFTGCAAGDTGAALVLEVTD